MNYQDDEMLMLSGIQHYMFCPRQWALIHIEQQWEENSLTIEGKFLHKNVDNPSYRQKNGDSVSLRSVPISSKTLGLYGLTDVVELHPSDSPENAIRHPLYDGFWKVYPVEYKRGSSKPDERDKVQLAAQTICLEEMLGVKIEEGALYYGETRRRELVLIDDELRSLTYSCAKKMHEIYNSSEMPAPVKFPHCKKCSLVDVCMPDVGHFMSASSYLKRNLYEETA